MRRPGEQLEYPVSVRYVTPDTDEAGRVMYLGTVNVRFWCVGGYPRALASPTHELPVRGCLAGKRGEPHARRAELDRRQRCGPIERGEQRRDREERSLQRTQLERNE